ncbi:tRNA lysidine(34) synthetase TilS [Sulfitobacter sp. D35]|uniref:tRNA lysidine(34) synthetase TilS n=1 Tax=Sulfitobacter sp. D35 TaxID=3083252 RepID=UPI00296F130F|nr:tRNA lysidine(34) synthetase TilS [Sulfitobacter sp. D35]MDW4499502.1 tRNA lysidine(34) synthetase TilS [Sulfitobacter sp. D35]
MAGSLASRVSRSLGYDAARSLGVAVSGGSDSLGLLYLLNDLSQDGTLCLEAVTVDHGLRPESADEAATVARICDQLGLPHEVLRWTGWDGVGNLQDRARTARYALIADWAKGRGLDRVALGHTLDDQAETVLMRLARGAGVDGLSGMTARTEREGIAWLRPLLDIRREELRRDLHARGVAWIDDPSNADIRFERVRTRKALDTLEDLGIGPEALAQVATRMQSARDALDRHTDAAAERIAHSDAGAVVFDYAAFVALPDEIARRLLLRALRWISRAPYAPRHRPVALMLDALRRGSAATADGCHAMRSGSAIWVFRECAAVDGETRDAGAVWDGRWRLADPPAEEGLTLRALGRDGLAQVPDWRETGRPHAALLATPSLWRGETLVSAPFAGLGQAADFVREGDPAAFTFRGLSH